MIERIRRLCSSRGLTVNSVEKQAGLAKGTISKWENSSPKVSNLLALCSVLEVPLSAVVDDPYAADVAPALTPGEQRLLTAYRDLNDEGQRKVLDYAHDLTATEIYKNRNPARLVASE